MSTITRNVKVVKTPSFPTGPDDDEYASWSEAYEAELPRYEPTAEDWACLRDETAAPVLPLPGEIDLGTWLLHQAAYYRSLDTELGQGMARECERTAQLAAFLGNARTWAIFEDRRDAQESSLQEELVARGRRECGRN